MAKMIKDVVLLTLIFSAILRLSNARGIGKIQAECKPPTPIDSYGSGCQHHYCDETQYYYDKEDDVCKECLSCDIGQQADIHCESQRSGQDVKCETCKPGTFSNSRSQGDCDSCTVCVDKVILAECTPTTNTKCGDCLPGFYFHDKHVGCELCYYLSDENKILKGCPLTTPRTPTTKKVSTTIHTTPPTQQTTPKTPISAKEATPTVPTPTVPKISQAGCGLKPRRYDVTDLGKDCYFRGWADVQGQGAANDYCRVVSADGGYEYLSCALAGLEGESEYNYNSPKPGEDWFEYGYEDTWFMKDEDADGRDDYCRCVGKEDSYVSCMKAGDTGFIGFYDFNITSIPLPCNGTKVNPFYGTPLVAPP